MEPGAVSKQALRQQVWDFMETHDLADFPRPVHGRIPNFKGSLPAAQLLRDLDIFASAQQVKVDPDKPLEGARLLALQNRKTLLVPTPRLRTGLFNRITPPPGATKAALRTCATSQGVRNYSIPVGLDSRLQVDLLVVGSVVVSEKGWRIGKGEGYADLEYAMMVAMGAVRPETPVLTIVHDCQVLDFPEALLEDHDLTVDFILTPTRLLPTHCQRPKPSGITWAKISSDMLDSIPVLRSLRAREEQAGKDVTLRAEAPQPAAGCPETAGLGRGSLRSARARRRPRDGAARGFWASDSRSGACASGPACTARPPPPRAPVPACRARRGTRVPTMAPARQAAASEACEERA